MNNIFNNTEVIFSYSRAQALEDGVLRDATELAKEIGFKLPVAITQSLYDTIMPSDEEKKYGQDYTGRLWDVLNVLFYTIRKSTKAPNISQLCFDVIVRRAIRKVETLSLWAVCGPGDNAEPVITIGFSNDF